ncbi:MAG: hypothetical protein HY537_10965 [Deltaproteobacteria bacterium]|nr:hypothetical protein [Deltaproteobacteria bacterium]
MFRIVLGLAFLILCGCGVKGDPIPYVQANKAVEYPVPSPSVKPEVRKPEVREPEVKEPIEPEKPIDTKAPKPSSKRKGRRKQ